MVLNSTTVDAIIPSQDPMPSPFQDPGPKNARASLIQDSGPKTAGAGGDLVAQPLQAAHPQLVPRLPTTQAEESVFHAPASYLMSPTAQTASLMPILVPRSPSAESQGNQADFQGQGQAPSNVPIAVDSEANSPMPNFTSADSPDPAQAPTNNEQGNNAS